jgi:hypothetical protein
MPSYLMVSLSANDRWHGFQWAERQITEILFEVSFPKKVNGPERDFQTRITYG